MDLVALKPDP